MIPVMMRAVVITAPKTASLQHIERWPPEPGEVLVRCKTAAICTTERRVFSGELPLYPTIGGHEFAGVIEWADESETNLRSGDRVVVDHVNRCGICYYCIKGHNNLCVHIYESRKSSDYVLIGGGFAEYTTPLASQIVKLPEGLDLEEASLIEPLACCIHSIKKAQLCFGDTIAIIGAGTMGAMHVMLAKLLGTQIIVSDIDEARLKLVRELGADLTVNPQVSDPVRVVKDYTEGRGADAVIVAAGSKAAGEQGLAMVGRLGRVVFYSSQYPPGMLEVDWNQIHYKEILLTGTEGKTGKDFREAVKLLGSGAINVCSLISRVISLEELPEELASRPTGETQRVIVRL
ncbi:MAG: zinc-binding dehydrogenase [Acidobacteria bacterium]|nr:zinc-binding dehydrogenase [Acidobacteriota bacterium]